jgi:anaerobic selenocysteine-containing dehydrogenase
VVFVNPGDIASFGLTDGDHVDLVSEFGGQERRAKDFRVVAYATPAGNAAAYYPETNQLVPLDHVAARSNTPVSKAVVIRLERSRASEATGNSTRASEATGNSTSG